MKQFIKICLIFSVISLFVFACSDNNSPGFASITVKLVDGPGEFDAVNVEVVDVMYRHSDDEQGEEDGGWESLNAENTGIINLLDLIAGNNVVLVEDYAIPAGNLDQLRLVLGENNTVVIDGETFPLKTPSAQQSGLKIKVDETLEENITYSFVFDFMVDKSIVMAGNSENIILKPVINATLEANSGALSGVVAAGGSVPEFDVTVEAWIQGELEPAASTLINENGEFLLFGLNDVQTYDIKFTPAADSGYLVKMVIDIEAAIGTTKDMGTIELDPES